MTSPVTDSPEDLVDVRTTVGDWIVKSRRAMASFSRSPQESSSRSPQGSFWRDSNKYLDRTAKRDELSPTTTSRSYMALAYLDLTRIDTKEKTPPWINGLRDFLNSLPFDYDRKENSIRVRDEETPDLNTFEIVHIPDLIFAANYVNRFYDEKKLTPTLWKPGRENQPEAEITTLLTRQISLAANNNQMSRGQVPLERGKEGSGHFFVTLHLLRALEIMGLRRFHNPILDRLCDFAREFCIEQCYYTQSNVKHYQDPVRLVFAGVIYALYSKDIDKGLMISVLEALAQTQQENGSWPATHPIFRVKGPWHITSHEVALSLTWLYFQPRLPDRGRAVLLDMIGNYFHRWVIPTFVRVPVRGREIPFEGWYDDHTIERNFAVGWATAIVCHFLVNYYSILNHHINRRVIESLNLEATSTTYRVDEDAHSKSLRWSKRSRARKGADLSRPMLATWPDIPPFAWRERVSKHQLTNEIQWEWTDPSPEARISKRLASRMLRPILECPAGRPKRGACSSILCGEPGTRKTSLVEAIAKILEWPSVTVPAAVIFDEGFDRMEACANTVFRRLQYLTGCVIFFDEFEEFFLDRGEGKVKSTGKDDDDYWVKKRPTYHDRTIAAFTTSSMLPRLEELNKQRRCLFFLATNHIEKIDSAIRRPGRFDLLETIYHPTKKRIQDYLQRPTSKTLKDLMVDVVSDERRVKQGATGSVRLRKLVSAVWKAIDQRTEGLNDTIRFSSVELALENVASELDRRPQTSKDQLQKIASKSLRRSV